jgi:NAD(P)-dependent dehydrogenase (short-subunit alcohol dehydrogenase family)
LIVHAGKQKGLRALTRTLAREPGPFGIRCNAAAPGVTLTARMERLPAGRSAEARSLHPTDRESGRRFEPGMEAV